MEIFTGLDPLRAAVDRWATPPVVCSLALLLFFLAARTRLLRGRPAAIAGLVLAAALLAVAAGDALFRARLLDPRRLPAALWVLLTLGALWLLLYRTRRAPAQPGAWSGPSRDEVWAAVAAGLGLIAVAALLGAPLGPPAPDPPSGAVVEDLATARATGTAVPPPARWPWYASGFQELQLYFDPWVAGYLLPALLLLALLALPALDPGSEDKAGAFSEAAVAADSRERRLLVFAAATLLLVLLPILVATFLRGPGWVATGPFEAWSAGRPRPLPPVALSELFWTGLLGRNAVPAFWLTRESPGLVLLALYLIVLPRQLWRWKATRGIFGRYRRAVGPWRYRLASALALLLLTVPLKMYGRWLLDVGYWLHFPEISLNF